MAHNNQEIEIKIKVDETLFYKLNEKLKTIANFIKTSSQQDEYFTPAHRNFLEPKFPGEWLSIRSRNNKVILNYKHFYPENAKVFTHSDEYETKIENSEQLNKIFSVLNLKKLITVDKKRTIYIYEDKFEIVLDQVKELGYFIEIEAIKDLGTVKDTRKKLFELAKELELNISKVDIKGYPRLLLEKKELLKP